ncbi:MAG: hypothetical protein COA78_17100 [Blastopirellula sp.]|nr:MAG: hypothetical protein COA78_17100 [Blastopirellula sp.]
MILPIERNQGAEMLSSEGFARVPNRFCELMPVLRDCSIRVMVALCRRQNEQTNKCWPSKAKIATDIGKCERTVFNGVKELEGYGLIRIERRFDESSIYEVLHATQEGEKPVATHATSCQSGVQPVATHPCNQLPPNKNHLTRTKEQTNSVVGLSLRELAFPLKGKGQEWKLSVEKLAQYQQSYPKIDIESELLKSRQWLIDNPAKRKTSRGMASFLNNWLNSNSRNTALATSRAKPALTGDALKAADLLSEKLGINRNQIIDRIARGYASNVLDNELVVEAVETTNEKSPERPAAFLRGVLANLIEQRHNIAREEALGLIDGKGKV